MKDLVTMLEMEYEPIEWDDPPDWLDDINEEFLSVNYHVHQNNFDHCLTEIQRHLHSWVKVGIWAFHIRRKKAYCLKFKDWRQFCEKGLGHSEWQINNFIKAARVFKDLALTGFDILPKNVSQCLPLTSLKGIDLTEAWRKVIRENAPNQITQKTIEATIKGEPLKAKKRIEVPFENWENFERRCREAGKDPKSEIEKLLGGWNPDDQVTEDDDLPDDETEEVEQERIDNWTEDLKTLVEEKDRDSRFKVKFAAASVLPKLIDQLIALFYPPDDWLVSY